MMNILKDILIQNKNNDLCTHYRDKYCNMYYEVYYEVQYVHTQYKQCTQELWARFAFSCVLLWF